MAPPGRPAGGKAKGECNSIEKYVAGGEETIITALKKIGKEIEQNISKKMERMMEQLDQIRKEWEEEKQTREEERRKEKEEWKEEKKNLERRIENLEWEKEKKDREKRKNNIIMRGVNKWEEDKIEQETKEFIKENLKIEVDIIKAYKVQSRGDKCTVVAEVGTWEQKREIVVKKEELRARFIDDDLTRMERETQNKLREKAKEEREKGNKVKAWEYLEEFDILGLTETWINEEGWKKIENKVSKEYIWKCIPAKKEHTKGRAKGGIVKAVRKSLEQVEIKEINGEMAEAKLKYNGNSWRIVTLYSQKIEETVETLTEQIPEEEENYLLIEGDFNARTGNKGGPIEEEGEERSEIRRSIDKVSNREGRILLNKIEERGWTILNGSFDEEGGWTYIGGSGMSVIDYIIGNDRAAGEVKSMKEGDRTESDHIPLEAEVIGAQTKKKKGGNKTKEIEKSVWSEEGYWASTRNETEDIWREIRDKVKQSITKQRKKIKLWKIGERKWYNREWKEKKRELRKMLRNLKKGRIDREDYIARRKEYKEWCKEQKKRHEQAEEEEIRKIKSEKEAWKYINKYGKQRKERISDDIRMDEWREYFIGLLGGTQSKIELEKGEQEKETDITRKEPEDITKEELKEILRKLKKAKAPEEDGIENEAWIHMSHEIGEEFWKLINKIWKEKGLPEDWNKGI
ncbi:golgin subfamily A member 6-like protein 22 [Solenopsis invicta]|uniref:golgin subfamily A member 6-like protein 22 n=1 Tax=Solenopsis invicta TaxID=13686 RepID=UPI00193C936C|nr:golgin subfamily A member 6-like protein 22 [Solenopsis invicta]